MENNYLKYQFSEEEIDAVLKKLKAEKSAGDKENSPEKVESQINLTTYFFDYATLCINKTQQKNR